jgi:hypothetical protein
MPHPYQPRISRAFCLCFGRRIGAFAIAAAAAMILAPSAPTNAEIEPKYYRQWQDRAPEALVIRVTAVRPIVTTQRRPDAENMLIHTRVEAEAVVEKIERTATGLKPGDTIRLQYVSTRSEPPIVGPRPIPVVKRGETYPAFLLPVSQGLYSPAARGASFEPLIEAR